MGFYNMQQGDAAYTKYLADNYAMSDNYHQPAMGGTGLDEIMLFFGDAIWFSDENGNPLVPPQNQLTWAGGPVQEIENPNPQPGTNNFWIQDGYGDSATTMVPRVFTAAVAMSTAPIHRNPESRRS